MENAPLVWILMRRENPGNHGAARKARMLRACHKLAPRGREKNTTDFKNPGKYPSEERVSIYV
jgi:hypothetical protein